VSREPRYRYAAFGLTIGSEWPLAPLLPGAEGDDPVDVAVRLGVPAGDRGDRDVEFGLPGVLRALVRAGREAFVDPDPRVSPGVLTEYVSNLVLAILMEQRGAFVVHASAIEIADGVVAAFTGPSGSGKSTMAGVFASRGFAVVTDDLLPLRLTASGVVCDAGPEVLKLRPDAAEALPALVASAGLSDKRLHGPTRTRHTHAPRHVAVLYELEVGAAVDVRPLRGHAAVGALLGASFCLSVTGPSRRGPLLVRCAHMAERMRVCVLSRPTDWATAGAVVDLVMADVAEILHEPAARVARTRVS
jgi:hypothetical protein